MLLLRINQSAANIPHDLNGVGSELPRLCRCGADAILQYLGTFLIRINNLPISAHAGGRTIKPVVHVAGPALSTTAAW